MTDTSLLCGLTEGQYLEVLDDVEVYNPCTVLEINSSANSRSGCSIKVSWIGWGPLYDTTYRGKGIKDFFQRRLHLNNERVIKCRAWVRYTKDIPWWPAWIFIRKPGNHQYKSNFTVFEESMS